MKIPLLMYYVYSTFIVSTPWIFKIASKSLLKQSHHSSKLQYFRAAGPLHMPDAWPQQLQFTAMMWSLLYIFGCLLKIHSQLTTYILTCVDTGSQLVVATIPTCFMPSEGTCTMWITGFIVTNRKIPFPEYIDENSSSILDHRVWSTTYRYRTLGRKRTQHRLWAVLAGLNLLPAIGNPLVTKKHKKKNKK